MVILVDSSVWIGHIRSPIRPLAALLTRDEVLTHPFVIGELACGNIRDRGPFMRWLRRLPQSPEATHAETLAFIQGRRLMGRGVGYGDVQLLAACKLAPEVALWTLDRRLAEVANELGVRFSPEDTAN